MPQAVKQSKYFIYGLRVVGSDNVFYVGVSSDVEKRFKGHISSAKCGKGRKDKISTIVKAEFKIEYFIIRELFCSKEKAIYEEDREIKRHAAIGHQLVNHHGLKNQGGLYFNVDKIPREVKTMVRMLSFGKTAKDIGKAFELSPRTVEKRMEYIKNKFSAKNITHLAATFLRLGIIK